MQLTGIVSGGRIWLEWAQERITREELWTRKADKSFEEFHSVEGKEIGNVEE